MNYNETLDYIHSLGNFSKPATLSRITLLLDRLCNPQDNFRSVHIAGTNGKGSVSAMLAKVFELSGKKTGLMISPYVLDFRERIQINGVFISEDEMVEYAGRVIDTGVDVTEFEFITAIAFLYFSDMKCDIVVAETGLGGRLDATNALKNVDAAVITKIGMDHTAILGGTIEKIAAEKCGIIKDGPVITSCNQEPGALKVIKSAAKRLTVPDNGKLRIIKSDDTGNVFIYNNRKYRLSLCGEYQIENALTVIETLANCNYDIPYNIIYGALKSVSFPARMEVVSKNPLVVLDGAHNPDGAAALGRFLERYSGRATALIGVMRDKDYKNVLGKTLIHCRAAVAVTVEDMPRALSAMELSETANRYCPCFAIENYISAIEKADEISAGEPVFVFGSLYLASGIREKLYGYYKNF